MPLITLPPELLFRIAELLPTRRDVNSLLQCCQTFCARLNHFLYRRNNGAQHAAKWALGNNSIFPLQGLNRVGIPLKTCGVDVLHGAAELGRLGLINYVLNTGEIGIDSCGFQIAESWDDQTDDSWDDQSPDMYETEGATPLYLAALKGHEKAARLLLDRGADPSAPTGPTHIRYPLIAATWDGHAGIVKMLLDAGADFACVDSSNAIPVMCAALMGNLEIATLLLDAGADIFTIDWRGLDLLLVAFQFSCSPLLVELLLSRGCLPPEGEINNYLVSAVEAGWYNVTKLLIQNGADVEYQPMEEPPVPLLVGAIILEQFDIAELFIQKGANVNARCHDQSCALHFTGQEKHLPIVKSLLAAGADVSATNAQGVQPLMLADSAAIVEILLANGADSEHSSEIVETALTQAVVCRRFDTVKALLQAGASTRSSRGVNLVHFACELASRRLVQLLIDYGADISANNPSSMSALFLAASRGRSSIVELLLERGADVEETTETGYTPLMVAARNGHCGTVNILIGHGASLESTDEDSCTALLAASEDTQAAVVDILLSNGASIEAKTFEGSNALILAAAMPNNKATVDRLLRDGRMDVDAQNAHGRTALCTAAMRGQAEAVESLLAHQPPANVTIKDHWGATALSMAVRNGHTRIVGLLLAACGSSQPILSVKDSQGRTVLDWARRTATGEIWRMLAATHEGAAVDIIEDAEEAMMRFDAEQCFCNVCGRCSICQAGHVRLCWPCSQDGVTMFCICKFCDEEGVKCVKGHCSWTAAECGLH